MRPSTKPRDWMNVKEAAGYLGVSRQTIYRLIQSGKLSYFEVQGVRGKRIRKGDLDALIKEVPARGKESSLLPHDR
jgi:excisionase family DNA binding protein